MIRVSIRGMQEAQRANLKLMAAIKPEGSLGRAVQYLASEAHRTAVIFTHVYWDRGGGLRASHRITQEGAARYRIHIDERSVNPRGQRPGVYGPYEHARGGDHAFYERTYQQGPAMVARAAQYIIKDLP